MNNKTEFEIGREVRTGWKNWFRRAKPVTISWGQLRRRVRVTTEWSEYNDSFILPLIKQFTSLGGRVVILDPLLDTSSNHIDSLWACLHNQHPGMKTVCWHDEIGLLEEFMSDQLPADGARVIFVAQSSIFLNDEDMVREMRTEPSLRIIHQAAGRKLGASIEQGAPALSAESVALDCIPTLIITKHMHSKIRDHGMYQRHLRAANMAIVDLLVAEPLLPPGRDNPASTSIVLGPVSTIRRDGPGENGVSDVFSIAFSGFPEDEERPHWEVLHAGRIPGR